MSSSEGNSEDVVPSCSAHLPRQPDEVDKRAINRQEDETYTSYYNRLKENIRQSNMYIRKDVRGDGNCFLYCIQDQLERLGLPNRSSAQLRADLVDYLRRLDEKDPLVTLIDDKYLDELSKDGTYVDEIAVRGMSRILNHDFHIVTSQRKSTDQGYLVTKIHESSNPDGLMLFGQIAELHYISLGDEVRSQVSARPNLDRPGKQGDEVRSQVSARPNLDRPGKQGISESNFKRLLVKFAEWYEVRQYTNMLKVLYRDHVPMNIKLNEATKVIDMLHMLITYGSLSSENLTILIDTIVVTRQFGFKSSLLPALQDNKACEVSTFSRDRQRLMKFGMELTKKDIEILDGQHNIPLLEYSDRWSLILDLVQRIKLCEENLDEFIESLLKGNAKDETPPCKPHLTEQPNEDDIIKEYLLTQQQDACYDAGESTTEIMNKQYHVDIKDMFTDLDLLKGNKNQPGATPTTLKEVLGKVKSTPACKVLIEGEAGIGKSTLLRYVAYNWASNKSDETFKGKIVFLVNIRDVDKDTTIVDAILKQIHIGEFSAKTNLPEDPKLIQRYIMKHDDEIVLLLDGLEDLKKGSESPICYFKKTIMRKSKVVLTSRCEHINEFIGLSSIHVKVNGFSTDIIREYIGKHFENIERPELGESLISKFKHPVHEDLWGYTHSDVYSLCRNPMLLLSVCIMWEKKQHLPKDKADLCKRVFVCVLNQFNIQPSKSQQISRFEDIPEDFVKAMVVLGKCMYEGLKDNQLYIKKADLKGNDKLINLALNLGFVYKEAPSSRDIYEEVQVYKAPHKLIVEALVGFYFYKLCQATGVENNGADKMDNVLFEKLNDSEWTNIRDNSFLKVANYLAIQFLGANAAAFLNHWVTPSWSTYDRLMDYLSEVTVDHREYVDKELLDHISKTDLEIKPHIDRMCNSIRHFFRHASPLVEVNEDGDFINLMRGINSISLHALPITCIENLCKGKSAEERGCLYAHLLIALSQVTRVFRQITSVMTVGDAKYLTAECQRLNIKYEVGIYECDVGSKHDSFLSYILSNPKKVILIDLGCKYFSKNSKSWFHRINHAINMCTCNLSRSTVNDILGESSRQGGKLEKIIVLYVKQKFSNQGDFSLVSLKNAPKLFSLTLIKCSLSGGIMNSIIEDCSQTEVKLAICHICFEGNDFRNIYGSSLADLMTIAPKLEYLTIANCELSGNIMTDMIRECSRRGIKLKLRYLDISGNDFSSIDGSLLDKLMSIAPKLNYLSMKNCRLTGAIMNDMIKQRRKGRVKLDLWYFIMSGNDFSNIDRSAIYNLLTVAPDLILISFGMENCSPPGAISNDFIRMCSTRGVELKLSYDSLPNDDSNRNPFNLTNELSMLGLDIRPLLNARHPDTNGNYFRNIIVSILYLLIDVIVILLIRYFWDLPEVFVALAVFIRLHT